MLVFGANGFLGKRIVSHFRSKGHDVLSASHKGGADFHFDLNSACFDFFPEIAGLVRYGIICNSITNIDRCKRERSSTWSFNVTDTIRLVRIMREYGITPVFFSSDLVFDGEGGNYREEDVRRPTTEYGLQKKAVEDFIMSNCDEFLVLRMSKLYSPAEDDTSPIRNIIESFAGSRPVKCADDQFICPTLAEDIPSVLEILIGRSMTGVFHLSAVNSFTRYEMGKRVAGFFGFPAELVERCSISDFDFAEKRPLNNTLNSVRVRERTGFKFTELESGLALMSELNMKGVPGCVAR